LLLISATTAPAQQVIINEYPIPTPQSNANIIALGPDGAMWFTERNSSKVGRITTAGVITEYPVVANSQPYAITTGPDGALWFVEQTGSWHWAHHYFRFCGSCLCLGVVGVPPARLRNHRRTATAVWF
jgi:streptogramin lyase